MTNQTGQTSNPFTQTNGSTYQPLEAMYTTGPAYVTDNNTMIDSGEYVAALYESYAADSEWATGACFVDYEGVSLNGQRLTSLGMYCTAAESLAQELWLRDLEAVQGV